MGITIKKNISIKKNWKEICREHLNFDPDICLFCNKGKMLTYQKAVRKQNCSSFASFGFALECGACKCAAMKDSKPPQAKSAWG